MNDEARLLYGLWESISDLIPTGDRQEVAANIIRSLIEYNGCDIKLMHDAEGECPYLDRAIIEVQAEQEDEIDAMDDYDDE